MGMPNNRAELAAVARDATSGIRPAIRLIRTLATGAGYRANVAGWISDNGRTVAHGWREFAGFVAQDPVMLDRLAGALQSPEPLERAPAAGPAVRLSPVSGSEPWHGVHHARVPDAELLQLLALLDAGVTITRRLYNRWEMEPAQRTAFPIDPAKLDRAAHAAVFYGLAVDAVVSGTSGADTTYTLRAEPIHLERTDGETVCNRRIRRAGRLRLRYTTDPAKVTHDRCAKH